jgi:arsenate reductase
LQAVLAEAGLKPSDLLSRRAKAYGELVGDRNISEEELLALMVQEPTLLRRPLAVKDGRAAIGFDKAGLTALASDG